MLPNFEGNNGRHCERTEEVGLTGWILPRGISQDGFANLKRTSLIDANDDLVLVLVCSTRTSS